MMPDERRYILLTVAEASVLKGAAQAYQARHAAPLPALDAAIAEVRRQFRREQGAPDA
jgi:hypothetical protein